MVSRLETLGYVDRETNPTDRRTDVVNVTSDGLRALEGVADVWREGDKLVESILGPEESKRFLASADKLSRALGGGPPKLESTDQEIGARTDV